MEKTTITLTMEDYKLDALEYVLRKEGSSVQKRLGETLTELYESAVPSDVREYVESRNAPARPRRPAKPSQPKHKPQDESPDEDAEPDTVN